MIDLKGKKRKRRHAKADPELDPVMADSRSMIGQRPNNARRAFWAIVAVLSAIIAYGLAMSMGWI